MNQNENSEIQEKINRAEKNLNMIKTNLNERGNNLKNLDPPKLTDKTPSQNQQLAHRY